MQSCKVLAMQLQGTETSGRLPREALLAMTVSSGTFSSGTVDHGPVYFESIESCSNQMAHQVAFGCYQCAERFAAMQDSRTC